MKTDRINFTGLDARPIKALVIRDIGAGKSFTKLVNEISDIGEKSGFDVFVQNSEKIMKGREYKFNPFKVLPNEFYFPWAQDNLTFLPNGKMLANYFLKSINQVVENFTQRPLVDLKHHIQGGNFFIVNNNKKNSLLLGKDELEYYNLDKIKKELDVENIYPISQPDFHIDLGIRPLKNKVVLVNDDNMLSEALHNAITNAKEFAYKNCDAEVREVQHILEEMKEVFEIGRLKNEYKNTEKIIQELQDYGFKTVRVPGCFNRASFYGDVNDENHYMANFMNAIVHEKSDGSLVYITNKSLLDDMAHITPEVEKKIGFSFHSLFKNSIKDYVKPEDIYFVSGDGYVPMSLERSQGGIHCLCAEVPVIE